MENIIFHKGSDSLTNSPSCTPSHIQPCLPFVDFNKQLEMIRNCVYSLLHEFQPGIDSTKLPLLIYMRLGINLDWFAFGCSTLFQFLQKYVSPYYELEFIPINTYDTDHFVLRLKGTYGVYNANPGYLNQFSVPYYPVHYRFETDPNIQSKYPPAENALEKHSIDLTNNLHSISLSNAAQDKSVASSASTPAQSTSETSSSKM